MKRSLRKRLRRAREQYRAKWAAFMATNPKVTREPFGIDTVSWTEWMKFCHPEDAIFETDLVADPFFRALPKDTNF